MNRKRMRDGRWCGRKRLARRGEQNVEESSMNALIDEKIISIQEEPVSVDGLQFNSIREGEVPKQWR